MEDWNEIRIAFEVARCGTLSRAADVLGLHRATVMRHVDSLESKLGAKLFVRHPRGYSLTDAGAELLRVAGEVDGQLGGFLNRAQRLASAFTGELTITSVDEIAPWLLPAMIAFRDAHPEVRVRYVASPRLFSLDLVEAHVAVRLGPKPNHPDQVVQHFFTMEFAMYAHADYVAHHGKPSSETELANHHFVGSDDREGREPFDGWLQERVLQDNIVFHSKNQRVRAEVIGAGCGLGFLLTDYAEANPELVEVMPARREWEVPVWLVTHADLHRVPKVRSFLQMLAEHPAPTF
ncbi:MAG: LysR family transcriptional regulator [Myxococcota bacterium]